MKSFPKKNKRLDFARLFHFGAAGLDLSHPAVHIDFHASDVGSVL